MNKTMKRRIERLEAKRRPADDGGIPFDAMPEHLQWAVTAACTDGRLDVSLLSDDALRELMAFIDSHDSQHSRVHGA